MIKEDYQAFKAWLSSTSRISSCPDAVSYLYAINRFLFRRICAYDLFTLIKKSEFEHIYACRHHQMYVSRSKIDGYYDLTMQYSFEYCNVDYNSYIEFEATKTITSFSRQHTLFIHRGNIACIRFKHPITDIAASIAVVDPHPLKVHASYCERCKIAFIHKSEYLRLRKKHHFLIANFCELSEDGYTPLAESSMATFSPLMLCGYSVKRNGLSKEERQILLRDIIYNGIMSRVEIIQYLEHFILFNGGKSNMFQAVMKWESDLSYVRNLELQTLPTVEVDKIKPYPRH